MSDSSTPLIMFGAGGHAKVIADLARLLNYEVAGFVDTVHPERAGEFFAGSVILGDFENLPPAVAAVGFGDNAARLELTEKLLGRGWRLPALIHPTAVVSPSAELGEGTMVMAKAVVQADARVGKACIVNTGAILEHDSLVNDGVHLAPRSCVCGSVVVGKKTFVGAGAVVREKMSIGEGVIIGAGSVVVKSLPDGVTAFGVPARVQKSSLS